MLAVATVCFGTGAITIWTAALMPQFFPIWSGKGNELEIVRRHTALWRVNAVLFTSSAVAVLIGCALVFTSETGPLAIPSRLVWTVAAALWVANNAMRMSAVVEIATDGMAASRGWVMIASAVFSLGSLALLRDLPPVVAHLPVLPLAIATGLAAV